MTDKWRALANCATTDPDAFLPEKGGSSTLAKAVCAACDVQAACLAYALEHEHEYGVYAGTTPAQRRTMRRVAAA